jgi:hypothetical protein
LRTRFDNVETGADAFDSQADAIVLAPNSDRDWASLTETTRAMTQALSPHGWIYFVLFGGRSVAAIAKELDLSLVTEWAAEVPGESGPSTVSVHVLHLPGYDRYAHAQALADDGHPDWAADLLSLREEKTAESEAHRSRVLQRLLLQWDDRDGEHDRLRRFFLSQVFFYRNIVVDPACEDAFAIQAEMWRRIGYGDMAARLLRTFSHSTGKTIEIEASTRPTTPDVSIPDFDPSFKPRLLVLTEPQPDYGADVLYDGLAEMLGDDNVVDYPWKGTLHGAQPDSFANYPCAFVRPGRQWTIHEVIEALRAGQFDATLYCASLRSAYASELQAITSASPTPVFVVDQSDNPLNQRGAMAAHAGVPENAPYFKREMLACVDYGPDAFPLPFAYPAAKMRPIQSNRDVPLFWAGERNAALRPIFLNRIEAMQNVRFDEKMSQDAYKDAIGRARIGLSFFGFGYDTVRYWELPAHGAMLMSERPPIRIPHNFVDGESAVFFNDLEELENRLVYYLDRPEEAERIGRAGREHLERYHTGAARARLLLAQMHWLQTRSY